MDCSKAIEKLSSYVDGALDEQTLEAVESHIAHCEACRRELAALQVMVTAACEIEPVQPPPNLKHRILESVRQAGIEDRRCAKVAGLLSAYVDDELPAKQEELVEAHASYCDRCAKELSALKLIVGASGEVVPTQPPADLRSRIAAAIAGEPKRESIVPVLARRIGEFLQPRMARLAYAGAAAAIVTVALVSLPPRTNQPPARVAIEQPSPAPAATATVAPQQKQTRVVAAAAEPKPAVQPTTATHAVRRSVSRHTRMASASHRAMPKSTLPNTGARPRRNEPAGPDNTTMEDATTVASDDIKTVEVAAYTEPAPEPKPVTEKPARPTAITVASAPLIVTSNAAEVVKQIKTEAVMRRKEGRTASLAIFSSRF